MSEAKSGDTVQVHYTGKLQDGSIFDTSRERDPLEFKLGEGKVIPGFEEAVVGMQPGEQKTHTIPATDAFGEYRDDLVMEIERSEFQTDVDLEVGQRYSAAGASGKTTFTIVELNDSKAKIDANHELAGKDLVFDIELVAIV